MVRRSLRIGIRLGVLAGLAFALFKIVQARRPAPARPDRDEPWAPPVRREREEAHPELVRPTMLESVSVRDRSRAATTTAAEPSTEPLPEPTVEADDDEVVILSAGDDTAPPARRPGPQAEEEVPDTAELPRPPAEQVVAEKAAAKKAPVKKAATKRAGAKKAAAKKAAKKAAAKKAAAKKAASKKAAAKKAAAAWVEPEGSVCPGSHPIKAKLRSGIFHLPGMAAYARTTPDRCYADEQAAEGDGLRKAAR